MAHKGAVKNVPLEAMCFRVNPAMTTGNDDGQAFVSIWAGVIPGRTWSIRLHYR